jgi:hypothetical protein
VRFHHAIQNGMQFKTYELFISGIFHLIFLDIPLLLVAETMESKTMDKEGILYFIHQCGEHIFFTEINILIHMHN